MNGPVAPKDPVDKRMGFYVLLEKVVEATERQKGKPAQEIYLNDGRLVSSAEIVGNIKDKDMLSMLQTSEGFKKLVHSIGVSIIQEDRDKMVGFVLYMYGKKDLYGGGTLYRVPITTNGVEEIISLSEIAWSEDDDIPGQFAFEFENPEEMATVSVKLYLNDGYVAPEVEEDTPVSFGTEEYQAMIAKSLLQQGNNYRIKQALKKVNNGEQVTIAYIGGSITQGAGAKPIHSHCYAYQSYLKIKELCGNKENLNFVKAGVGGTPSELGMIRYDRDVLKNGSVAPDIVVVEFAVNDEGDETKGECFESLVRKILYSPNKPAVILLFSVFANDYNLQERLAPIGIQYQLPMISVKDAVVDQFYQKPKEGRVISKAKYFYDIYHPSNSGHTVMADCIANLFAVNQDAKEDAEVDYQNTTPLLNSIFENVGLLDRYEPLIGATIDCGGFTETDKEVQMVEMDFSPKPTAQFPYNWMHTGTSGEESFRLKMKSSSLLLVFKDSGDNAVGKADVFVDGSFVLTADPHKNGWTHCNAIILYRELPDTEHEVEIRMADDCKDKKFTILGFGYIKGE